MATSRRAVLRTGVALLAANAVTSTVRFAYAAAEPNLGLRVVRQGLFTGVGLPGIFAAIQQGYFVEQGVRVEPQFFGNGPAMISAMLGGSLDVTHADMLSWASAVVGGRNIVLVTPASLAPTPEGDAKSTWRIVATKASGITTTSALVGRKIGVGASQLSMVSLKAWLEKVGIDAAAVKLEIVGQPQAMPNMLKSGAVDAALLGDPTFEQVNQQVGLSVLGWPYEVVPPDATFSGLFSTGEFAAKNSDLLVRYVRAYRRGAAYFNQASKIERARLMKLADVDLEALDRKFPGLIDAFRYNRAAEKPVNLADTQRWIDMGVKYGGVPQPLDINPFVSATAKENLG
jgi:NitT/TauT family transport system substrate-binding protein